MSSAAPLSLRLTAALIAGLAVALPACWEADVASPPAQCALARTVRVATADGATIALHHHRCAGGPPVILVHGIASNHRFWDLDERHSLASWLADRGHDVWLLDLRGHGDALYDAEGRRQWAGWTVDDYGQHDAASAVDYVRDATGYDQVGWVGHSMGGMVGSIYAATGGWPSLSSLVMVGSPSGFSRSDPLVPLVQAGFAAGGATLWFLETPMLAVASADLDNWGPFVLTERLYNPDNLDTATADAMLRAVVAPLTRREMQHFARMIREERFVSFDGATDYLAAMKQVRTPLLAVAGLGDQVVPPAHVRGWVGSTGGPSALWEVGQAAGMAHDYGHLDLGLAERAPDEVFPAVARWLTENPPKKR